MKKVDLVVDLQFGSTGKGLIAGYLAEKNGYDVVINANMPNAGHTYINDAGRVWMHKVLPNGIVSPNLEYAMLGAGSVFSMARLALEIEDSKDILKTAIVVIHPNAVPLKKEHFQAEQRSGMHTLMGSTAQGSGAALIEKISRPIGEPVIASQTDMVDFMELMEEKYGVSVIVATQHLWQKIIRDAESILAEGAQGFSLGVSEQFYPYCTSRDCTPARFMADMGIPLPYLRDIIGTARCHPIRVAGTSGDHYIDQAELTWESLGQIPELTTVTKKVRRVFSFSNIQLADAITVCQPTKIFLNFCNYLEPQHVVGLIQQIEVILEQFSIVQGSVDYLGFGPKRGDVLGYDEVMVLSTDPLPDCLRKPTYAMKPEL